VALRSRISFTSFKMKEPYEDEKEWGFQQTYLFATRMLKTEGSFRPTSRRGSARPSPPSERPVRLHPAAIEKGDSRPCPRTAGARPSSRGSKSSSTSRWPSTSRPTSTTSVWTSTTCRPWAIRPRVRAALGGAVRPALASG
jgi:hypothetical protein